MESQKHIPYYVQIKAYLTKLAAEKNPRESIPSELQLAEQFNVSRGTVKQAIMDLVYEGVLYREQGRGTFVAPPKITRSFDRLPSFTDDIRRMGYGPCTRILNLKQAAPAPRLQQLYHLQPDEPLVKLKRLVLMEQAPIVVLTSYLNPRVYPTLQADEIGDSLYEALSKKYEVVPVKAQDTYSIVDVSPQTAELLQCRKNATVCYSQRVAYLENDMPVEYVESFIRGDRFKLDICIGMEAAPDWPACEEEGKNRPLPHYGVGFRNIIV